MRRFLILAGVVLFSLSLSRLAECKEEVNIIPTPKEMKVLSGKFPLSLENTLIVLGENPDAKSKLGAEEINKKIKEIGGKELIIKKEVELSKEGAKKNNLILIGTPDENGLLKTYLRKKGISLKSLKVSGYIITSFKEKRRNIYLLAGKDSQGALYACVSFRYLIRKDKNKTYALSAKIKDWPDCKYRSVVINPKKKLSRKKALPYLDWALYHKFNFADVNIYMLTRGNYAVPKEKKIIERFKNFNDYAFDRGIETNAHAFYWNIGVIPDDKDNPEFKGCMQGGKGYYCWSRDKLIKKRAEEIACFIKDTHFKAVLLHVRDGSPTGYWNDRCSKCRERFGNDRAAGDANYINIMYQTIKKTVPDTKLLVVAAPYYGNLDIPENKPYRDYFARLSKLIPEDVYLVNANWDRESQDSWKKVIRQPVMQWRNLAMDPWHADRDFSTQPSFAVKSGYYPETEDISYPKCSIGYNNPAEVFALQAIEFMWNINASGNMMFHADTSAEPIRGRENMYRFPSQKINGMDYRDWLWYKSATEPREIAFELLPRLCEEAYGKESLSIMPEILRMGIARRVLLKSGSVYRSYYNIVHNPDIIKDQYLKAKKAVEMLEEFQKQGKDFKPGAGGRSWLGLFLYNMRIAMIGGKSHYLFLSAEKLAKEKKFEEAQQNLNMAEDNLKNAKKELEPWQYRRLKDVEKALESLKFRLFIMSATQEKKKEAVKVAIYNPNEVMGKVYGEMAIYSTLIQDKGISPVFITSLKNLFQYDCVIVPDCKAFGKEDKGTFLIVEKEVWKVEAALRDYVSKEGGGLLFYHDSVGYQRFPLGRSIFPELCIETKKVNSTELRVVVNHPVVKGYKKGEKRRHIYYDHISMQKGEKGKVVIVDKYNNPVVIAGELGKGRVLLNGTIIYLKGGEAKEAVGIDKDLLINSVYWLANKVK